MDREFEQAIGRFRAQQFRTIADEARCKRVRIILDAHSSRGEAAAQDPLVKKLTAQASRDMHTEHGLEIPVRRRLGNFGETHTTQVVSVDGTLL